MSCSPRFPFPVPDDEAERIAELNNYQILDTPAEAVFDRLTRMTARRFGMPIALVSLVDEKRQWFKSRYGIGAAETPRELAFCAHAIMENDVMVVPDATQDPRFLSNQLVTDRPDIRFYAGAPLISNAGHKLGTICVIDQIPHYDFDEASKKELAELASIVIDEMELRLVAQRTKRDLEALRKTQQDLETARQKAEYATAEKSQFIATISHELRTPMNGILGMSYLLADTILDKTQREYVDTINHSAQNLLLLVNDVLDLSKIEAGELLIEKRSFDIKTSFSQTVKLLTPLAQKKNTALLHHVDPSIPDLMIGDAGRFTQIITNLVGNAVKFTEGGKVETGLQYDGLNNCIYCEVIDTGIGIPKEKHGSIFEKFTQGDAAITQKYGGTGLGLAITKHLVKMLGGNIGFSSKENVGSHFWFTLPITLPSELCPSNPDNSYMIFESGRIDVKLARVLIAEDHPVNQLFLAALLKKFGFIDVDVANNGIEVIKLIDNKTYDAIFMDCKMPELDGYETTRMVRSREKKLTEPRRVPIIAMTANAFAGDREVCFDAGMDEYITKPLYPERLKEVLEQWFVFTEDGASIDATTQDHTAPPPFDFLRLQIVARTDADQATFLNLFFRLSNELTSVMADARHIEDFLRWENAAHSLKGSAANLGMESLEAICKQAEQATALDYDGRTVLLQRIRDELERIKTYIHHTNSNLLNNETQHVLHSA